MSNEPPERMPSPLPAVGELLAGKYEIEHVLGEGGMCVVFAAKHKQLKERVAIKLLRPQFAAQPEVVERFMREGRAAIRIRSDHVVQILDVDVLPAGDPYMVMEHLAGNDLDALLLAHGPSPVEAAVDYILQAAEAIAEAHALGIVHRDLKPANIFLTQRADGSAWVKVLDFGISRMTPQKQEKKKEDDSYSYGEDEDEEDRLTSAGMVMGSPHYMSPEQLRSTRNVDQRTDVWSLGTILHELLAGEPAFDAPGGFGPICARIMDEPPTSLAKLRPDVPPGLIAVILRCLEKQPDARFPSVAELALALANFASPAGRESARLIAGILHGYADRPTGGILVRPSQIPWGSTNSAWVGVPKPKTRRAFDKRMAIAAGVLLLGGLGLATYVYSTYNTRPLPVAAATPKDTASASAKTETDAGRAVEAVATATTPTAMASATPAPLDKHPKWRPPASPSATPSAAASAAPVDPLLLFDERK